MKKKCLLFLTVIITLLGGCLAKEPQTVKKIEFPPPSLTEEFLSSIDAGAKLSAAERTKFFEKLTETFKLNPSDKTRLHLIYLLQLPDQSFTDLSRAALLLKPLKGKLSGLSPATRGLVILFDIIISERQQSTASHNKAMALQQRIAAQLNEEKEKSAEMAQKLRKLLEIEKIMNERQKH